MVAIRLSDAVPIAVKPGCWVACAFRKRARGRVADATVTFQIAYEVVDHDHRFG